MTQKIIETSFDPSGNIDLDQLKEWLGGVLRMHDATVTFIKRDGTERVMQCTLREEVVVPYEKTTEREKQPAPHNMSVWDIEKQAWRSFKLDTVTNIKFNME